MDQAPSKNSGIGGIRSAAAVSAVFTRESLHEPLFLINAGICGSIREDLSAGQAVLANRVINHESGRSFHPDIFFHHPFIETDLESFARPVTKDRKSEVSCGCVDMEAAGFLEAAFLFTAPHRTAVFKVVSDFLDFGHVTKELISGLMQARLPELEILIREIQKLEALDIPRITPDEQRFLDELSEKLHLTVTLRAKLFSLAREYGQKKPGIQMLLKSFQNCNPGSKNEREKAFAEITKLFTGK